MGEFAALGNQGERSRERVGMGRSGKWGWENWP